MSIKEKGKCQISLHLQIIVFNYVFFFTKITNNTRDLQTFYL
jgi:hypothetical protein